MRDQVDAFDWGRTPLGPRADWPAELETVVQQVLDSHFPKVVVWGPDMVSIHNDAFLPILRGKPDPLGRRLCDIWAEVWDEIGPIAERAYAGEATFKENFPLVLNCNGTTEKAYFTFCYSPLRLRDGTVAGMLDTVIETTSTVQARADLQLANQELTHRLKNTLAIVQSIASQTLRKSIEPDAFRAFDRRLAALARAHDTLLGQSWSAGSLVQTVRASLEAHTGLERVQIDGPDLPIGSHATMALSLMLHELAANAAKYGAMANEEGQIALDWHAQGDELTLSWRETGGPAVSPPDHRGFGSRLIERGLGPGSKGTLNFLPEGLHFTMTAPLATLGH